MKFHTLLLSAAFSSTLIGSSMVQAGGGDDPLLGMLIIDKLQTSVGEAHSNSLEADAWIGKDFNKLRLKMEGDYKSSDEKSLELQALYSRSISAYWDVQLGVRWDAEPRSREWAVLGIQGLAPYHFDIDAALFVGKEGRTAARIEAEYELLLTQKLILTPEIEANAYGKNDRELGIGSGLSDLQANLYLRYEVKREIAPYIGFEWKRTFGNTADYAQERGEDKNTTALVFGLRAWF